MTAPLPAPDPAAVANGLRQVQWGVLATLAACGVIAAATGASDGPPAAGADSLTYTAVGLALVSALTRRRRPAAPAQVRSHVALAVLSLIAAAGVGLVGAYAATTGAPRTTALALVLAGAIFALRRPPGIALDPGSGAR